MLLITAGIALLAFMFTHLMNGGVGVAVLTWIGTCSVALILPIIALTMIARVSHNITWPLADVMAAADSVASGDLTVRVPENTSGEFGELARTFNRMIEELERIDIQRRNLTADVAHELRTPLHVIQGNLEGILDGVYQPTPEHIRMLLEETHILSRLVEDLRTLSLAESGHLPLHKERVVVAEFLEDLATSFTGQAEAQGITLNLNNDGLSTEAVDADVMRLNQVLANLIVNALRFTPRGGSINLVGEITENGVRITVIDTGQGISPNDLPYVFDRFWRGDPARTRTDGTGGGLGLAIVKQLVELHGGHIGVQSTPGNGTTFIIDMPRAESAI